MTLKETHNYFHEFRNYIFIRCLVLNSNYIKQPFQLPPLANIPEQSKHTYPPLYEDVRYIRSNEST